MEHGHMRGKRTGAHELHARAHEHTRAHTQTHTADGDICRQCRKLQTYTKCPRAHTRVRSAAQIQTRFSEKLMELRHRGLKTGSCTQRVREGKKEKEHRLIHMRLTLEESRDTREAGRRTSGSTCQSRIPG